MIDVPGNVSAWGQALQLWQYNGTTAQKWAMRRAGPLRPGRSGSG
jgi:hypothetical protein